MSMKHISGCVAVLAAVMALATGCGSSSSGKQAAPAPTPAPTASPSPTPLPTAVSASADAPLLESVALTGSEVGATRGLAAGGDKVTGQITLDNCGFTFTSEEHRIARREYYFGDESAPGWQNEVVSYDTDASAALAMTEWDKSVQTCPTGPTTSKQEGTVITKIIAHTTDSATLPAADNDLTSLGITDGQEVFYGVAIMQRQGRFLDVAYLSSESPITTAQTATATALATVTGKRLLATVR